MLSKEIKIKELPNSFIVEAKTDTDKMNKVIENYYPMVYKLAMKYDTRKLPGFDNDDLISIGMEVVFTSIQTFNPNVGSFSSYVYRNVWGKMAQEVGRFSQVFRGDLNQTFMSIDAVTPDGECLHDVLPDNLNQERDTVNGILDGVEEIYNSLRWDRAYILQQSVEFGRRHTDIAKELGCTSAAVGAKLKTTINQLRKRYTVDELHTFLGIK